MLSEPGKDLSCGGCASVYSVASTKYPVRDSGSLRCVVCDNVMFTWNGSRDYSCKLKKRRLLLSLGNRKFEFIETPLAFTECRVGDLFGGKNNKTLGETIRHRRYVGLAPQVIAKYSDSIKLRLGDFMLGLKRAGDPFYRQFLNPHGDRLYCEFRLEDPVVQKLKGLYCFTVEGVLKYIGRSRDSFGRRINQGYGRIHPKNCFRDGQSTNCHKNALVAEVASGVRLHVHPMPNDRDIVKAESRLIALYKPMWNVLLRTKGPKPMIKPR